MKIKLLIILLVLIGMGLKSLAAQEVDYSAIHEFPDYSDEILNDSFIKRKELKEINNGFDFQPYFFANEHDWEDVLNGVYDENGVAIRKTDSIYFPTTIIRTALTSYYKYDKTGLLKAKEIFLIQMNWLKNNFYKINNNYGFWVFSHRSKPYDLDPGWVSAMSQGMGLGACLMAYNLTGDEEYLKIIDLALKAFYVPVENGGFKRDFNNGLWFEEYPTEVPTYTLNGFIFSIAGLYNFYENTGSKKAKEMFDNASRTLSENLDSFLGNFTSYYSHKISYNYAKDNYHKIHIIQLAWMYVVTGDSRFYNYAKKFLELHVNRVNLSGSLNFRKISSITSNNCINCEEYGTNNLFDDRWSWGKFWSSYKNPELVIKLDKEKIIKSIVLYGVNLESLRFGVEVYDFDNNLVQKNKATANLGNIDYITTGGYQTYIRKIELENPIKSSLLKLNFLGTNRKKVLALRELQLEVSMDAEMDEIISWIETKVRK